MWNCLIRLSAPWQALHKASWAPSIEQSTFYHPIFYHAMTCSYQLDPTASSHRRRTRTVQQEEAAEAQRDRNKQSGDYGEALLEKWTCKSDKCINEHGVCYVAYDAKHYSLTMAQLQNWALAIGNRRDGASLNHPPVQLYAWRRGCPTK